MLEWAQSVGIILSGAPAWIWQALRLSMFVNVMLPWFLPPFVRYALSKSVLRGVKYGPMGRQSVDVYLPLNNERDGTVFAEGSLRPVVVFVSGGAWMIGHKAWCFLLGLALQRRGVLVISVDYRNFPTVCIPAMVDDVADACEWTLTHAAKFGGDPRNISLVGQSAGAQLTAMLLLRRTTPGASRSTADIPVGFPRQWVGISGPYDLTRITPALERRGLHVSLIEALAAGDILSCSPNTILTQELEAAAQTGVAGRAWPRTALFHGTDDQTVDWQQSVGFAATLRRAGATDVLERYYDGKSHTDPILEDPLTLPEGAEDPLLEDLVRLLEGRDLPPLPGKASPSRHRKGREGAGAFTSPTSSRGFAVGLVLKVAKCANPF
jgi:prenylcysteine alpha-carboxyl methylesterase